MPYLLRILKICIFLTCLLGSVVSSQANNLAPPSDALKKLSQSNAWWRLVHYKQHTYGVRSQVDQDDFFLSSDGYKNPLAEIKATFEHLETALNSPILLDELSSKSMYLSVAYLTIYFLRVIFPKY